VYETIICAVYGVLQLVKTSFWTVWGVDLGVVVDFLNQYNAEVWVWDIMLSPEDEKALTKET